MNDFNKNGKQHNFNQIKGEITELLAGEKFCSMTICVGHENKRNVNLIIKKDYYPRVINQFKAGDRVAVKFYITSRLKNGRYYTMANALCVEPFNAVDAAS